MATSKRPRAGAIPKNVRRNASTSSRRQEGYREDVGDLLRKGEWFRRFRTLNGDVSLASLRAAALKQADALGSIDPAMFAVGGALRAAFDLVAIGKNPARVKRAENPAANASLGFAGPTVEVAPRGESAGARLRVKLDPTQAKRIVVETVRMFRYEPSTKRWVLVPRSGVAEDGSYAWIYLHRPGLYTPIGLPRDPAQLRLVWTLYTMKPLLRRVREAGRLPALRNAIANQANLGALLEGWFDDPDTPPQFDGLGGSRPLGSGSGQIGLPPRLPPGLPFDGLPEFDILDDICPPWRGPRYPPRPDRIVPDLPIKFWPLPIWGWTSAGPLNFAGRIKSLAINPLNRNVVYAGAADGGVWKSTNAGGAWKAMMFTELSMAIGAIAVARTNTNIVYAATGEDAPGYGATYPGVGVYKSIDAGLTWMQFGNGIIGDRCTRILVDPTNADRVFVASNTGLFLSTTGGATWSNVLPGHICDAVMEPTNPNRLFAAIWNDGVYRSIDGGATWERAGQGTLIVFKQAIFWRGRLPTGNNAEWIKLAMGLNGAHGSNYLLAKMGKDSGKVYRSTDGGTTFFALPGTQQPAPHNEWTNMVAVNPDNHNMIFAGGIGLDRSTNGGTTFAGIGGTHADHQQLVFDPVDSNVCYVATDGGVYKSTDAGGNWALASNRLVATQLYSIGVSQSGAFKLGSGTQDQGIVASEGPVTWRDTNAGNEGGFFVVDPNSSANIYTTPWNVVNDVVLFGSLRRSRDGGFAWTDIRNGMTAVVGGMTTGPANVGHIAVKPGDSNTLIAVGIISATAYSSPRIFRSTDQGDNWTSVLTLTNSGTRVAFAPSSAARSRRRPRRVYVATEGGRVFRSNTSGAFGSFSEPYIPANRPTTQAITALAIGWNDANLVWIGCGSFGGARVLRSTDGGANWENRTGVLAADQLPNMPVSALVIDQNNPDVVYVANDIGVFRTQDGGNSWHDYSDGFLNQDVPRIIVTELALRRSTNTLYASTMGRGAYRRAL